MKKALTSLVFIGFFGAYGLYQYFGVSNSKQSLASSQNSATIHVQISGQYQTPSQTQKDSVPVTTPTPTQTPMTTPTPVTKPTGQYVDGAYRGSVADAYYGNVQVEATVSGGKLVSVSFLQYPNDRSTSRYINSQAMPVLKSEAIQAQSAHVSTVSGASDTSEAFRESLSSALSQAKA